jgi:hypothetical protein
MPLFYQVFPSLHKSFFEPALVAQMLRCAQHNKGRYLAGQECDFERSEVATFSLFSQRGTCTW